MLTGQVCATITQLFIVHLCFTSSLTSNFFDSRKFLALTLGRNNTLLQSLCLPGVFVQVVIKVLFKEISNKGFDRLALWRNGHAPKLGFCLALKYWLFNTNQNGSFQTIADISRVILLFIEASNHINNRTTKYT